MKGRKGKIQQLLRHSDALDSESIELLWQEYFPRLRAAAHKWLHPSSRRVQDDEDVAAIAIEELILGLANGAYSQVHSDSELWSLLITIMSRRIIDTQRASGRDPIKFNTGDGGHPNSALQRAICSDLGPAETAMVHDTLIRFYALLDMKQCQIAQLRLRGESVDDISARLGASRRTVYRKLKVIREVTSHLFDFDS